MAAKADIFLPAGPAASAAFRADVLSCTAQRVRLSVDGRTLVDETAPEGIFLRRFDLPASSAPRHVTVAWDRTRPVSDLDPRPVAARLNYLDLVPARSPTSLRVPQSLGAWSLAHEGIDEDGWTGDRTVIRLTGGDAATLVVQGEVPPNLRELRLEIVVNGEPLLSGRLPCGPFTVDAPVPACSDDREVELRWERQAALGSDDTRTAAARLAFVGLATGEPPAAVEPDLQALAHPALRSAGVHRDGWLEQEARLELRQRAGQQLVVKIRPRQIPDLALDVRVDGRLIHNSTVDGVLVTVRDPPAPDDLSATRCIEITWSDATPLSAVDYRRVAGTLLFAGFVHSQAPGSVTADSSLADPNLVVTGMYEDAWLERDASFLLTGGPAASLVVSAQLDRPRAQAVDVFVDGRHVGSAAADGSTVELRTPIASAAGDRRIDLRWQTSFQLSSRDERVVSARLVHLRLAAPSSRSTPLAWLARGRR